MCAFCTFLVGHVVVDGWLKNKQMNAQKEKILRGSRKLPQTRKKVCDEN